MDDIEERHGFNYESFFDQQIQKKKMDHSYRVFKKVSRDAANFPAAREFSWGKKEITVSNTEMLLLIRKIPIFSNQGTGDDTKTAFDLPPSFPENHVAIFPRQTLFKDKKSAS